MVQYEAKIKERWIAIVRYDTAHGFSHRDVLHPNGSQDKQPLHFLDQNMAFTYALQGIKMLWRWYREGFEGEMSS